MTLIDIEDLYCGYPGREVITGLNLKLEPGGRVGLAGHTGSGKTTLLKTVMGLVRPVRGTVRVDGAACSDGDGLRCARRVLSYLFQHPDDQLFCPTVIEDVAFGPLNLGRSPREAREIAEQCLEMVGLAGFGPRLTHRLSGGEKRLASLAGVLAMRPKALLLDEPTTGLDPESKARVAEVLTGLDLGLLVVSHEWDFLLQVATEHYMLDHGHLHAVAASPHTHVHVHPLGDVPHSHDE
ncbi:MAG: energy-coupling factor ABC transporter ATP-binding protein [Acidobacteriota bacterium]